MNIYRRARRNDPANEDYWRSFVDVMTTISIVFVFFVCVIVVLTVYQTGEAKTSNDELQAQISSAASMTLKEKEQADKNKKLVEDLNKITNRKKAICDEILTEFNKGRPESEKATYGNGKFVIKLTTKFPTNVSDLSKSDKPKAEKMGELFGESIQKFKYIENENLDNVSVETIVRIKYIEVTGHASLEKVPVTKQIQDRNRQLSVERAGKYVEAMMNGLTWAQKKGTTTDPGYGRFFRSSGMSFYMPIAGTLDIAQTQTEMDMNQRVEFSIIFNDEEILQIITSMVDALNP